MRSTPIRAICRPPCWSRRTASSPARSSRAIANTRLFRHRRPGAHARRARRAGAHRRGPVRDHHPRRLHPPGGARRPRPDPGRGRRHRSDRHRRARSPRWPRLPQRGAAPRPDRRRAPPADPAAPFEVVVHRRYNPENITAYNIVPGLLGIVLTLTLVMMTAIGVTREQERGTMESLLATPVQPLEVMIGKLAPVRHRRPDPDRADPRCRPRSCSACRWRAAGRG